MRPLILCLATMLCLGIAPAGQAAPVAQVSETKGAVSVVRPDGRRRLVAPQSELEAGDTVMTEENSIAVIAFNDGGKVALRPNTRFAITEYNFSPTVADTDRGIFSLLAGGLRTITGLIGKRGKRDSYRLQTATSTIGIRGTEFSARLCKDDCAKEGELPQRQAPAARIAALQGRVTASDATGRIRTLAVGDALAEGDAVETAAAAWAGITFSDDSRVVLRQQSRITISMYAFSAAQPASDNFVVTLLKGAFRAVTGRLGKRNPAKASFVGVTATIGIRGTEFDAWCVASGYTGGPGGAAPVTTSCDQGLLASVSEGRVAMTNAAGSVEAGAGEVTLASSPNAAPGLLAPPVRLPADDGAPAPGSLPVFGEIPTAAQEGEGLLVQVHEGRIALTQDGRSVELGKGQSGFAPAAGGAPERLETVPGFFSHDSFLRKVDFDAVSCTL